VDNTLFFFIKKIVFSLCFKGSRHGAHGTQVLRIERTLFLCTFFSLRILLAFVGLTLLDFFVGLSSTYFHAKNSKVPPYVYSCPKLRGGPGRDLLLRKRKEDKEEYKKVAHFIILSKTCPLNST
jgi:hypothetical protein